MPVIGPSTALPKIASSSKETKEFLERREAIRAMTVEGIEQAYKDKYITAGQKNNYLLAKSHQEIYDILENKGYFKGWFENTIKHYQKGWENIVEAATHEQNSLIDAKTGDVKSVSKVLSDTVKRELYYSALGMIGALRMTFAPLASFGEMNGQKMENAALAAGASPRVARILNITTDIGSQFIPTGVTARSFVKTVQSIQKRSAALASKIPKKSDIREADPKLLEQFNKEKEEAARLAKEAEELKVSPDEQMALQMVVDGLKGEGIKDAAKIMESAAESVGKRVKLQITPEQTKRVNEIRKTFIRDTDDAAAITKDSGIFTLSTDLKGAKPRYNMGNKEFIPVFESDFEKALFIVAQTKPSQHDARYMLALKNFMPGVTEAEFRIAGREVRNIIKDIAKKSPPGEISIPSYKIKSNVEQIAKEVVPEQIIKTPVGEIPGIEQIAETIVAKMESASNFLRRAAEITKRTTVAKADAELPELARKFGIDLTETLEGGLLPVKSMTNRHTYGYLKALEPHVEQLAHLAKKALSGDEAEQVNFIRYATELFTTQRNPEGEIIYSKKFMDMLMHWDPRNVADGRWQDAIKTFALDVVEMHNANPTNTGKFILGNQDGFLRMDVAWWAIGRQAYTNLLLPLSYAPALLGNTIGTGMAIAERSVGSMFTLENLYVASKIELLKEAYYFPKGLTLAVGDGLKAFSNSYRELRPGEVSRMDFPENYIPGVAGRVVNFFGDTMMAMDNFFRTIIGNGVKYSHYMREGLQNGLRGEDLGRFITERSQAYLQPQALREEMELVSRDVTYSNQLGTVAQMFQNTVQSYAGFLYFPFMKNFINMTKYLWHRTPGLQLFQKRMYDDIKKGGATADMVVGRLTLSNLMSAWIYEMAKEGLITGSGPADVKLRPAWLATNEPYSFKTYGEFIPYAGADPATSPIGLIADFAQISDQLDEATFEQMAMAAIYSVMKNYVDKGTWHTLGDIVDVLQSTREDRQLPARLRDVLLSPVTNVITGGPLVNRVARMIDPVTRDTRTYADSVINRYPVFSKTLPARKDGYGDPVSPPQPIGTSWFGVFGPLAPKHKALTDDPVKIEGNKLSANLPEFDYFIGGGTVGPEENPGDITPPQIGEKISVPLTPEQRHDWQEMYSKLWRQRIKEDLHENEEYINGTQGMKKAMFEAFFQSVKEEAGVDLLVKYPDLGRQMIENKGQAVLPRTDEESRPELLLEIQQAKDDFDDFSRGEGQENLLKYGIPSTEPPINMLPAR